MTANLSFPSACVAMLVLGVLTVTGGCKDQDVPRTPSGEPIPFDHVATLPGDHPPVAADAAQAQRSANPPDRSQAVLPARSIKVTVKLSPALTGKAAPGDTVFIFARAAQGPKMPLAIVRKQAKELPITVTLDDSMAMVQDMKMSSFPQLVIGARVSKTGDAIPKPGDLEGYAPPHKTGVAIVVIDSVVGANPMPAGRPAAAAPATGFQHAKSGNPLQLDIPAEVKAKWKAVELSYSGKNFPQRKVHVSIGGEMNIDQSGLLVHVVAFVPAFQSDAGTVTSASNSPDNPAVLVQLRDKARVLSEGWVFQKYPDFNTYQSEKLKLQLLSATATGG
ncbi:MAG TPA: hypothetical protein VJ437_03525 [Acidiferrobacterales bacterium]|nr:hypothetical protein [Acidiferrobacterales bacterium]